MDVIVPVVVDVIVPVECAVVVKGMSSLDLERQRVHANLTIILRIRLGDKLVHDKVMTSAMLASLQGVSEQDWMNLVILRINEQEFSLRGQNFSIAPKRAEIKGLHVIALTIRLSSDMPFLTDYMDWRPFPFDRPQLDFRLELDSGSVLNGCKLRFDVQPLEKWIEHRPQLSFKRFFDRLGAIRIDCEKSMKKGYQLLNDYETNPDDGEPLPYCPRLQVSMFIGEPPYFYIPTFVLIQFFVIQFAILDLLWQQ
jgi:hypothetical protein